MNPGSSRRLAPPIAFSFLIHALIVGWVAFYFVETRIAPEARRILGTELVEVVSEPEHPHAPAPKRVIPPKPVLLSKPRVPVQGVQTDPTPAHAEDVKVKSGDSLSAPTSTAPRPQNDSVGLPAPTEEYLVTRMPEPLTEFRGPYPEEAKKHGVQGTVLLDILIDESGQVRQALVTEGPGFGLNEAAAQALLKYRFKPAYVELKAVAVRIRYAYRFVLER